MTLPTTDYCDQLSNEVNSNLAEFRADNKSFHLDFQK